MPVARGNRRRRRTAPAEEPEEEEDDGAFSFGGDDGGTSPSRRTSPRRARGRGGGARGRGRTQATDVVVADDDDDADQDTTNSQMTKNNNNNDEEGENGNDGGDDHNYDEDVASAAGRYGRSQQSVTTGTVMTSATQIDDPDGDTFRIMLSTDNHLGYQEDNTIRGNDSFAALEEVLYLARSYKCDMVLLAGDLFHENRPSRRTLFKTMEIFRRYCMGPNPVQVQILPNQESDQTKNTLVHGKVNYEDESYSVDLPVFSIHGNHDDPSRDAGGTELFAALDLLNVANLVNYFGKQTDTKDIRVDPICLKKGSTRVALYGLGSMRDERLNRMWRDNKIHFSKPQQHPSGGGNDDDDHDDGDDQERKSDFFNIFALHQNRDVGRGAKNAIKEDMIPEWMDLICWGHEHECKLELQESVVGTFRISQPGSSVATSLSAGEAETKKVGLLDIRGREFRLLPVVLTQVRSFVMGSVSLAEERALDPDDAKVDLKVHKFLNEKVDVMVLEAAAKRSELLEAAAGLGNPIAAYCKEDEDHIDEWDKGYNRTVPLKNKLENPNQVLIRLRVEHSGFTTMNNQRFGAKFVRSVANPDDILLYHRKKAESKPRKGKKVKDVAPIEPEEIEEGLRIEDLVVDQLDASEQKLELFDERQICDALDSYVNKQSAQAINEKCDKLLSKEQKNLIKGGHKSAAERNEEMDEDEEMEDEEPKHPKKKSKRKKETEYVVEIDDDEEEDDLMEVEPKQSSGRSRSKKSRVNYSEAYDDDDDYDDDDVEIIDEPSPPNKVRSKKSGKGAKTPSRRKKKYYSDEDDDDEEEEEVEIIDSPPTKKSRGKKSRSSTSSVASRGNLSQSTLSFEPVRKKTEKSSTTSRNRSRNKSYDDGSDEYAAGRSHEDDDDDWGTANSTFN